MVGAVDIGGTKIAVGLVDPTGRVVVKHEIPNGAEKASTRPWIARSTP